MRTPAGRSSRSPAATSRARRPSAARSRPRAAAGGSGHVGRRPDMELHERIRTTSSTVVGAGAEDPFAVIKDRIHQMVITELGPQLYRQDMDPDALRTRVLAAIRTELAAEQGLSREDRERLVDDIAGDTLGHGPIERLLADDTISEVMVNGSGEVWIERAGQLHLT